MRTFWPALLLLPALAMPGYSWQAAPNPSSSLSSDLKLTVRGRGNQSTFQIGEVIPLELLFTSSTPDKYRLDTRIGDRSGRQNMESFEIEPMSGWNDPLSLYFRSYGAFIGGGLGGEKTLSAEPAVVEIEMNEWVRFKNPGQYRIVVKSKRVSKLEPAPGVRGEAGIASNELLLTIVPAKEEWQLRTLQQALAVLNAPAPTGSYPSQRDSRDRRQQAVKALRYLGTAQAAREMARRFNDRDWTYEYRLGLIASPAREVGLDEMRALLVDPDFPVTSLFLSTMSNVALPLDAAGDIPKQREDIETRLRQELTAALGAKRNEALAVSKDALSHR